MSKLAGPTAGLAGLRPVVSHLTDAEEQAFQQWYATHARQQGLDPNPDSPLHFYDYRAAFKAGAAPDASGHWPSTFKRQGHPRMIVDGVNTATGEPLTGPPRRTGR